MIIRYYYIIMSSLVHIWVSEISAVGDFLLCKGFHFQDEMAKGLP